ncbi:MAG: adenosylcobalamin-dependent ribonucleoside-diphosphate reductase [Crocinitomicaceae bacterium]|nr:adenosylcobalamin-dependent ribonucleoside-diphosphate reductase [Crocinitomicaceae bacterium]
MIKEEAKTATRKKKVQSTYTFNEVFAECIRYFNNDELAATTWMNKYAMKNKRGQFLEVTPDDMHRRMAKEFARIEASYDKVEQPEQVEMLSEYGRSRAQLDHDTIYHYFKNFNQVIPQGSVMAGLGNPHMLASLSNCVVMPEIHDSYGGIFKTDEQLAQLFKRRCGVGVDLSTLRPANSTVSNSAGTTSGAVSFMERFSNTTREVAQNGRRGALMLTIDIAHPDVEDFITIKQDLNKVTGANISLRLSDEFMEAVKNDTSYTHRWPIDAEEPSHTKTIQAKELWNKIIDCAHNTAEPGLIFWDRQHHYSTSSVYPGYKNVSTNPCSEIAMQGGDSCRLIAINLYNFVDQPFTENATFDHEKFYSVTYESQRLMDDLVDLELEAIDRILTKVKNDPEPDHIKQEEINTWELLRDTGRKGRRTGLGFTALSDTIAALGFTIDSDESLENINEILRVKCKAEFDSSIDMSIERGSFEGFDTEIEKTSEFVDMLKAEFPDLHGRMMLNGRRNISISTVAPTGSLSMLAQTSSGIEPVFMLSYKRRRKINVNDESAHVDFVDEMGDKWQEFDVYHGKLKEWMKISGKTDAAESPYANSTASEIDWKKRVQIQAIAQKYVTHSISSTINLPNDVSKERVGEIYMESWLKGLKGITVYRDGSRTGVLVSTDDKSSCNNEIIDTRPPKRPDKMDAEILRFQNNHEKWIAVIGLMNGRPYEIFTGRAEDSFFLPNWVEKGFILKIKEEGEERSRYDFQYCDKDAYRVTIEGLSRSFDKESWNYAKLISGVLRHGMPLPYVVDLVSNLDLHHDNINTWKNGVVRALKKYIEDGTRAADHLCPACDDPEGLIYEEGCLKCKSCGHSKCG